MPELTLIETGQRLDWPDTWDQFNDFQARWGLTFAAAIRALALGYFSRVQSNLRIYIISGRRSREEQERLVREWRAGARALPASPVSAHLTGGAFDVGGDFAFSPTQWRTVGVLGEKLGLRWGGRFSTPDRPHFELPGSRPARPIL